MNEYTIAYDGERYLPWSNDPVTGYEHIHRYLFAAQFARGKRVLDIACGEGYGSAMLANLATYVVGVDIDAQTVIHATKYHARSNLSFVQANAQQFALAKASIDLAVSFETLEHFEAHDDFLRAVKSALTPDGILIISTPNRRVYSDLPQYTNRFHKRELYRDEFVGLLSQYFAHVQILGQDIASNSVIAQSKDEYFLQNGVLAHVSLTDVDFDKLEYSTEAKPRLEPRYFIAVCSDNPLPVPTADIMVDNRRALQINYGSRMALLEKDLQNKTEQSQAESASLVRQIAEQNQRFTTSLSELATQQEHYRQLIEANARSTAQTLAARDKQLTVQQDHIEQLETSIAERDEQVAHLQLQTGNLQAAVEQLEEKRREFESLFNSWAFRLVHQFIWPITRRIPFKGMVRNFRRRFSTIEVNPDRLHWSLQTDLSQPFPVGNGALFLVQGWCYHPDQRIQRLEIMVDGVGYPITDHSMLLFDVMQHEVPDNDRSGNSLLSGFRGMLPFEPINAPTQVMLSLRASFTHDQVCVRTLGELSLLPSYPIDKIPGLPAMVDTSEPLVAICMATYNPPPDLLAEQIESIVNQTHQRWICIINDDRSDLEHFKAIQKITASDDRFYVYQNSSRLGFYLNFERALTHVPKSVDYVALSDQDDRWYPDKIATTLAAFEPDMDLVYCDMDIVKQNGDLIAPTYWTKRRNNYTDLATMIFANTVTGAATMIRSRLLDDVLPFPLRVGDSYHDHWLACVALTRGKIGYVSRSLYAYRQHTNNVLGHYAGHPIHLLPNLTTMVGWLRSFALLKEQVRANLWRFETVYSIDVRRLVLISRTLEMRLPNAPSRKKAVLRNLSTLDSSITQMTAQYIQAKLNDRPTLAAELYCLMAVTAHRLLKRYYTPKAHRIARYYMTHATLPRESERQAVAPAEPHIESVGMVDFLQEKIAPLHLSISRDQPRHVNILLSTIDFRYIFGGYISTFNLALHLDREGYRVRIVLVDYADYDPILWRLEFQKYGLSDFLDRIEIDAQYGRIQKLVVNPDDAFIACQWWTAHIAHQASVELGQSKFTYFIQEFEPMVHPMGVLYALAYESYSFPHNAVFSTELLREYFRENRLGVFCEQDGEANSVSFQNAINKFEVNISQLQDRQKRKLLFYARPEQHAARNLFELGALALISAIEDGLFDLDLWEFDGIGSVSDLKYMKLAHGAKLRLMPKTSLEEYITLLPAYDIGLSLMLTPHPSLVPLEMAAAGMPTITNTYANKTAEKLLSISTNFIPVSPTINGVKMGLTTAMQRVDNVEDRIAGSRVNWATTWDGAFGSEVMEKLKMFIG